MGNRPHSSGVLADHAAAPPPPAGRAPALRPALGLASRPGLSLGTGAAWPPAEVGLLRRAWPAARPGLAGRARLLAAGAVPPAGVGLLRGAWLQLAPWACRPRGLALD